MDYYQAFLLLYCSLYAGISHSRIIPIQFSIPESKIVPTIPIKQRSFASIVPDDRSTHIYHNEQDYYKGYQDSYYAITHIKGGWDCMRHYEILANGCIPYFIDLDKCPPNTMILLPKKLILEAMNLPGVPRVNRQQSTNQQVLTLDFKKFDTKKYFDILHQLLTYTRNVLTTKAMAAYLLHKVHYNFSQPEKILFIVGETYPDYLPATLLIGLRQLLGDAVTDVPYLEYLYSSWNGNPSTLYGKGFTYTKNLPDIAINRTNIEERIKNHEFEFIIYGSVHRGTPFIELVQAYYPPEKIIFVCGEDCHNCTFVNLPILFLREWT